MAFSARGVPGRADARFWRRAAWAALAAAVVSRLILAYLVPLASYGDESHLSLARLLLSGRYADNPETLQRLPAASWLFALGLILFRDHAERLALLQRALGVGTVALGMGAADLAWGRRAAALAGLLLALHGYFAVQECFLISEPLARFLLALALFWAIRSTKLRGRASPAAGLGIGAVCGLAALTRGELAVLGPVVAAYLLLAAKPAAPRAAPLLCLGAWLAVTGGWILRNGRAFGYYGLAPIGVTTMLDTALPLVQYDQGVERDAKRVLREEVAAARGVRGRDPLPRTRERLMRELGYGYLRAETALGSIVREAVLGAPLRYLALTAPHFLRYLMPPLWTEEQDGGRDSLPAGPSRAALWSVLRLDQLWGLFFMAAAAAPAAWRRRAAGRPEAGLAGAALASLWIVLSLVDYDVPRIQTELFVLLGLLGGYAADGLLEGARAR